MKIRINFILLIYFAISFNLMNGQSVRQTGVFRGSAIRVPGASVSYQDNDPVASWYLFTPKYDNVLTFEVDRNAGNAVPFYQNTSWTAKVELVLHCFTTATQFTAVNKTYTLHFDASKPDAYNLPRISEVITEPAPYMNRIELHVKSLTVTPSSPLPKLDDAFSLSMSYKRSGVLKPNFQSAFSAIPAANVATGVFKLGNLTSLFPISDELDVEWTFIDAKSSFHAANISTLQGNSAVWTSKYLNFSRVTVPYTYGELNLPAIYNDGFIVYRIRQVYYDALKNRLTGQWVEFHNSKLNTKQVSNNHTSKLNWTSSISFAEEGKHKDVVTYFDGAQRDRQSVTYDNSSSRPIIAETYYDKEGRKSAAILPAPHLTSSEIKYYPSFNVFFNTVSRKDEPYDADAYSYLPTCVSNPIKLSVASGASHYYSPFNILKNDGFNQFIPDAEGYPLTISEYTNDNTGRIRRQTGVGAEFQFDKGHYTEYIYAKPSTEELDRLFGTNVGYSSHYFKNVVIDPNGQQSVTYTDLSGKTIATALEGSATNTSIQDASNNTGSTAEINLDLVKPSDMKANPSLAKTSGQATINVPFDQVVRFSLSNDRVDVITANCKESFCNDCYYDIDFTVKDNCGVQVNKFNYKNYNETDVDDEKIDEACDRFLAPMTKWEDISLNKGENYVSVDVKIPPKVIDFYEKKYLESDKCVTKLSDLIEKHRLKIQPNSCIQSCEECLKYYGDVNQQKSDILKRLEQSGIDINADWEKMAEKEAKDLRKHCDLLCDADNECELKRSALIADVSPGGQYALKFYRDPEPGFYAIEGPSYILYHLNTSGFKKKSGLTYNFPTIAELGSKFGGKFPIKASQVPDIDTLLESWTDEMADYLVQFHPEYCYYEFCRDNRAHLQFIADMQKVEKWSEALTKGYIVAGTNPLNFASHIVKNMDPHFALGALGHSKLSDMENLLRSYDVGPAKFNIFELAVLFTSPEFYDKDKQTFDLGIFADVNNAYCLGQKDVAWLAFRNLYIEVADQIFDVQREAYVGSQSSRCVSATDIGIDKFNESLKDMSWWMRKALRRDVDNNNWKQVVYRHKTVRFQNRQLMRKAMEVKFRTGATSVDDEMKKSKDSLRIFCDTNCINMAEGWIQSLSFCDEVKNNVNGAKDKIRTGLIAVCRSSCGEENYSNGAASVSPKDPKAKYMQGTGKFYITLPDGNIVSSFDEVINLYTSNANRAKCNGLYIDYPKEYHVIPQFEPRKLTTQVDTCSCENLKYERTQFLLNPKGASTLYQYLKEKYPNLYNPALPSEDFSISEEDFDIFVESCRDRKCKYLPKDIEVPYVLECAPKITCDQFNNAKLAFEAEFGFDPMKINDANDQPEYHYKKLWAGYLNKKLGVNANYVEYEKFAILCKDCKNDCFISDFIQEYVTKNGLTLKDLTMADFLDIAKAYNTANGTIYTPEHILTMFLSFRRIDCFELTSVFYVQVALPKGGLFNTTTRQINAALKIEFDKHFKTKLASDVIEFMFTQCMINNKPITDFRCDKPLFSKPHSPLTEYKPDTTECARKMDSLAVTSALEEYHRERQESVNNFRSEYISKCLTFANTSISALMRRNEFHYTLYYYGQDGNLLATIPPAGVKPLDPSNAATVAANRIANAVQIPDHMMKTTYEYNSLNQVIAQNTPDGGTSRFLYDQLGRLIVSQNAEQNAHSKLSYTIYDRLGRIIESGELELDPSNPLYTSMIGYLNNFPYLPFDQYMVWITQAKSQSTLHFVTRTYYDKLAPISTPDLQSRFGSIQQNLRHRIASITLDEKDSDRDEKSYSTALHYSYDVLGNVKTLVSENNYAAASYANQKYKTVHYDYDLVSGKVNKVYYQKEKTDQFIYKYTYDAENRIKNLFSSKDDVVFNQEVQYEYYLHGPLARTIYGEDQVQGIDYAYTLQGWLKGINASTLNTNYDMGRDGDASLVGNINAKTA
ncbi:MAG: hypothetical protein ACK567_03515, partial [Chitinophagales bacterium]|nr:hypothetical protein [Sphingobacteriales bacterium]